MLPEGPHSLGGNMEKKVEDCEGHLGASPSILALSSAWDTELLQAQLRREE